MIMAHLEEEHILSLKTWFLCLVCSDLTAGPAPPYVLLFLGFFFTGKTVFLAVTWK